MINKENKNKQRKQRAKRVTVFGTAKAPRLNVYRSLSNMYAQLIDDEKGVTLVAVNTIQPKIETKIKGKTKKEAAYIIGFELGKEAVTKKITAAVFDRNGYIYTGRVEQVAAGAREAGLKF